MKPTKQTISDDAVEREANEENDVSFIGRRKIIKGLSGAPFLLTFSHNSQATVASFARCAAKALDPSNPDSVTLEDLNSNFGHVYSDGTDWWSDTEYHSDTDPNDGVDDSYTSCEGAEISDGCLSSFDLGGGSVNMHGSVSTENNSGKVCDD
jgi:hypothetical protein